jgi:DinB superfamily
MPPSTPYTEDLGSREPIGAMRDTVDRIRTLMGQWPAAQFERSYGPGKWTARQILIHLAQTELALGTRARMALSTPGYVAQPFDQDVWIGRDGSLGGRDALEALIAMSTMNRTMFEALTDTDRAISLSHPDYGPLTVDWIIHQMAGHQIHHLKQLERIG